MTKAQQNYYNKLVVQSVVLDPTVTVWTKLFETFFKIYFIYYIYIYTHISNLFMYFYKRKQVKQI